MLALVYAKRNVIYVIVIHKEILPAPVAILNYYKKQKKIYMRLSSTPGRLHKRIKKCCKAGSTILLKVVTEIAQTIFFCGYKTKS